MPAKNDDLHGNVPDRAEVALLLIDVINDLEFIDSASSSPTCSATPKSASTKTCETLKRMSKGRTAALRRHSDCPHKTVEKLVSCGAGTRTSC